MPTIDVLDMKGKVIGNAELSEQVFGIEPNEAVVHQVVVAQLANIRQGTKKAKTRASLLSLPIKDKVQKAQKPVPKFAEAVKNLGVKKEPAAPVLEAPAHLYG